MENYFNNANLLTLLLKWKFHLIIIVAIAAILAAVFSSPVFITPKFKSIAVVYPSNISPYSDESETEQMFQLLHSQDIRDSVIRKFDLPKHWKIDHSYKYYRTAINYEYSQAVKITKTPYDAISIEVFDKDPEMAANMASSIIDFFNGKVRSLHNEKYLEVMNMYEKLLADKQKGIDSLETELYNLNVGYGLLSYDITSEQIMRGYLQTIEGANKGNINMKGVMELKKNMEKHGGRLITLVEEIKNEVRTMADFRVQYEDAVRFYKARLTYANIVTSPYPADKKAYPIRWLIVAISMMVTLFFAVIVILIIENYRAHFVYNKRI